MPRNVAPLSTAFARECARAIRRGERAERYWRGRGPAIEIQSVYAMAYQDLFSAWEAFLEDVIVRLLCGYSCGAPTPAPPTTFRTLAAARDHLLHGRPFISWAMPDDGAKRFAKFAPGSLAEQVLTTNGDHLEAFAWVRHGIGHRRQGHARANLLLGTTRLCGTAYGSPGAFLREWNTRATDQERWLETISNELRALAASVTTP